MNDATSHHAIKRSVLNEVQRRPNIDSPSAAQVTESAIIIARTIFSDEHHMLRAVLHNLREAFRATARGLERSGIVDRSPWSIMAETGLLCPSVS